MSGRQHGDARGAADQEACLDRELPADPRRVRPVAAEARARLADRLGPDDLDDLEQAVAEVVANAVEHGSRPGGPIRVEVACAEVGAGVIEVRVRVTDTGRGAGARRPPGPRGRPDLDVERGRGRDLVRRLVQEVVEEDTVAGHVTELWLRRPTAGGPALVRPRRRSA